MRTGEDVELPATVTDFVPWLMREGGVGLLRGFWAEDSQGSLWSPPPTPSSQRSKSRAPNPISFSGPHAEP